MTQTIAHHSKEFFVDGKMLLIRPLIPEDEISRTSYKTLKENDNYFVFGELGRTDAHLLSHYLESDDGFVFLAINEECPVLDTDLSMAIEGIAIYAKNPITMAHEMSVLVTTEYIDTRLAFELFDTLIHDAADHNVKTLTTIDHSTDRKMRSLADKLNMQVRLTPAHDRTVNYTLQVDQHPGMVII